MKKVFSLLCVSIVLTTLSTSYASTEDVGEDVEVVFLVPTSDSTEHISIISATNEMVEVLPTEMLIELSTDAYKGELIKGVPQGLIVETLENTKTLNNTINRHIDNHIRCLDNCYVTVGNEYKDVPLLIPLKLETY